jgi:hypothetical protein
MNLIQLVSGLPPNIDGIGDYALQLARRLRENHLINTSFIVADPRWNGGPVEGFHAIGIPQRTAKNYLDAIERSREVFPAEDYAVLIHFSPYSYQLRGYPRWLERSLKVLRTRPSTRVHIIYHELDWTDLNPLRSGFWLSPLQRQLIRRVTRLVDIQYTNTELHRRTLEDGGSGRVKLIPNFSTLGEPRTNPSFAGRQNYLTVFGRSAQRQWTYKHGRNALRSLCARLGIERIVDIGSPIEGDITPDLGGVPIVRCGRLEPDQINHWMATTVASFMYYPIPFLTKSSVHAVSCAHGTIPFVFDDQAKDHSCPGLITGEDFFPVKDDSSELVLPPLGELSSVVHRNYQARASFAAAETFARYLLG